MANLIKLEKRIDRLAAEMRAVADALYRVNERASRQMAGAATIIWTSWIPKLREKQVQEAEHFAADAISKYVMTNQKIPPCPVCGASAYFTGEMDDVSVDCKCRVGRDELSGGDTLGDWARACDEHLGRALRTHGIETVAQVDSLCKQNKQPTPTGKEYTMDIQPHQQRVIDEKTDLDAKREKLGEFKKTATFAGLPWQEQERLNTQAHIMTMYSAVLGARIAEFI
jgi:hypothetical protein